MPDAETAQKLGITGGWGGIERALREQMIREGYLKPEDVHEADSLRSEEVVKALETAGARAARTRGRPARRAPALLSPCSVPTHCARRHV
jgi:ABC-type ATPase with predicted acetyltransferase domain